MALGDLLLPRMSGSVGLVVVLLLLLALFFVINSRTSTPNPPGVPLIREPPGATRFSLRTRLAYYTDYQNILQEAYDDVCTFVSSTARQLCVHCCGLRMYLQPCT